MKKISVITLNTGYFKAMKHFLQMFRTKTIHTRVHNGRIAMERNKVRTILSRVLFKSSFSTVYL